MDIADKVWTVRGQRSRQ